MVARTLLAALLAFHSRVQQLQRVSNENVVDAQPGVAFPPLAPVIPEREGHLAMDLADGIRPTLRQDAGKGDRKSTRLNSSHSQISYAVFCLKKKKTSRTERHQYGVTSRHRQ